ncbi:MAG: hypothetical protein ACFCUM_08505 [Bacteroidales bacterium]
MTINQLTLFLKQNIRRVKSEIIPELDTDFTTLDFIKKFAKKFEGEYIRFLYDYKENNAFKEVHIQIADFLDDYGLILNIKKSIKVRRENEYGEMEEIQLWEKKKSVYKECYY